MYLLEKGATQALIQSSSPGERECDETKHGDGCSAGKTRDLLAG